ncbi:MAG TPA: hypothetical protein VIY96_02660 [Thermoanaerobaculia bacterium]
MKSLYHDVRRRELKERLGRLTPETRAQWGKFDAPRMVVHCTDALQMALGRIPTTPKNLPIRHAPLKQLFVYWLPWPKGAPTAPELLRRTPAEWEAEVSGLLALMEEAGSVPPDFVWPAHPAFGRMSRRAWGVLGYRHLDHHFRQFGV